MMVASRFDEKDVSDEVLRCALIKEDHMEIQDTMEIQDETEVLEPDEYIEKIGQCGIFQIRTQMIFCFFMLPLASQIFITYFTVHDPPWRCKQNSTGCRFHDVITPQDSARFMKKCDIPRNEWEFTKPKHYSLVTQVMK